MIWEHYIAVQDINKGITHHTFSVLEKNDQPNVPGCSLHNEEPGPGHFEPEYLSAACSLWNMSQEIPSAIYIEINDKSTEQMCLILLSPKDATAMMAIQIPRQMRWPGRKLERWGMMQTLLRDMLSNKNNLKRGGGHGRDWYWKDVVICGGELELLLYKRDSPDLFFSTPDTSLW